MFKLKQVTFQQENNNSNAPPIKLDKVTEKQLQILAGKKIFAA
jgi:hypothetical protein